MRHQGQAEERTLHWNNGLLGPEGYQTCGGKASFWLFGSWMQEFRNISEIWGWWEFWWGSCRLHRSTFVHSYWWCWAAWNTPPHQWSTFIYLHTFCRSQTGAFSESGLILMRFWIPSARLLFPAKYHICAVFVPLPQGSALQGAKRRRMVYICLLFGFGIG